MVQFSGEIKFVNQPEGRAISGSINIDGRYVGVPARLLSQFSKGDIVTVEAKPREFKGKTYYDLDYVVHDNHDRQPPTPPPAVTRAVQGAPATPKNTGTDSRMIFITGIVGRAMGSGKFPGNDMMMLTEQAMKCYERATGITKAATSPNGDMDDDISYIGRDPRDNETPF